MTNSYFDLVRVFYMFSSEKFDKKDSPNKLQSDCHNCSCWKTYTGGNFMQVLFQLNLIFFRNNSEGEKQMEMSKWMEIRGLI